MFEVSIAAADAVIIVFALDDPVSLQEVFQLRQDLTKTMYRKFFVILFLKIIIYSIHITMHLFLLIF
jgi:hypothetical protein